MRKVAVLFSVLMVLTLLAGCVPYSNSRQPASLMPLLKRSPTSR